MGETELFNVKADGIYNNHRALQGSFTAAVQKHRVVTNLQLEKALLQCTWVNSLSIRQDMTPNIVASANFLRFDISRTPEEGSRFPLK